MEIIIQNADESTKIPLSEQIKEWVHCALGKERSGELTVRIVGEIESAALNERFRNVMGATNVLAFPYDESPFEGSTESELIGDLVVCAPVLEREAVAQDKALSAHWAHILIHGTLHLVGYDHQNIEDTKAMEERERDLLGSLGFEDPYESIE
ncbi:MAG: rRNA maturation RNase YbeY [Gammaproteobacteria bacterium]|nr:rRNA maturation RNase YbeY [Gammaproteobacteria bacterium]